MLSALSPLLAENALFHSIGEIFHPVFLVMGWVLAEVYSVIPNYAAAIAVLTILIMLALTPVTVKSTKSMIAMQRLQPEMKKLQAKYKGPENRELLNQEMMKLYKENGTSPFGACLPSLLQMPFLIVLYSLIRGLGYTVDGKAEPRYIPSNPNKTTGIYRMAHDLVLSKGQMHSVFGMDLSQAPCTHHGGNQALEMIPYLVLSVMAIFLQYYQMKQMNSRNPQAAAANPQMQTMQKFFPIIFGLIYLRVPAGATIYMVVSSAMRIGTQEVMFRTGYVTPVSHEREIGAASKVKERESPPPKPAAKKPTVSDGTGAGPAKGTLPPKKAPSTNGQAAPSSKLPMTRRRAASGNTNGNGSSAAAEETPTPAPKAHPRSKAKKTRKAR